MPAYPDHLTLIVNHLDESVGITSIADDGDGVLSVTTDAAHGLVAGDGFRTISTGDDDLNGDWTVATAPTTVTLTATSTAEDAASAATGTLLPTDPDRLAKGYSLFIGPPVQDHVGHDPALSGIGGGLGVDEAATFVAPDEGAPPQGVFGSGTTKQAHWYDGFEVTTIGPRNNDLATALSRANATHKALAMTAPSGLQRTSVFNSSPEYRGPDSKQRHRFVTRGLAWHFT